jgi:ActR/RegA family two-component response regulator
MFRQSVAFIDDDEELLSYLKHLSERSGREVHCFSSSKQALAAIESVFPGVIFIDYQMMEENGLVLLSKIKKILPLSKVIMFTGEGSEKIAVQAMKKGADDYLVKPVHDQTLLDTIENNFNEFFSRIISLNGKYEYPLSDTAIARYEFLRAVYSGVTSSIKGGCHFFSYSRQDFYNYEKRFHAYGTVGLLKKKDFEKLPKNYFFPHRSLVKKKSPSLEDFLDSRDDVQQKLEMMREAAASDKPNICDISNKYGFTRESFYQIYRRFQKEGMLGLIEKKKGRPSQPGAIPFQPQHTSAITPAL